MHKILIEHAHPRPTTVTPGEYLEIEPDLFAIGIQRNPEEADKLVANLEMLGVHELPMKGRIFGFFDHASPAPFVGVAAGQKRWHEVLRSYGIPITDSGAGIAHLIIPEQGYALPGEVIVLRDSHTPTMGAVGAFAMALASQLSMYALGRYWIDVPRVARINIEGKLNKGVLCRDVALQINGRLGQAGVQDQAVEYTGGFIDTLPMDLRFTLCNLVTEIGGMASYIDPDQITLDWLNPRARRSFRIHRTDSDFVYETVHEFDVSTLEPQVAAPFAPDNVMPVSAVEGRHVDQAYIGSCASGRLEDIAIAAKVIRGRRVHPETRFIVTAGSREVLREATRLGYVEILHEANAVVTSAGCGACPGLGVGVMAPGEIGIACNTRNFVGRMGPDSSLYLGSPATVAASAIEGRITNPAKYL